MVVHEGDKAQKSIKRLKIITLNGFKDVRSIHLFALDFLV